MQITILAFKYLIEYEKSMLVKYYKYKKRVTLPRVMDIIKKMEEDAKVRMKKLDDAVNKLNLNQLDLNIDTLNDIEAIEELLEYQSVGFDIYNDYIIRVRNPYAREVFKELREGIFSYINILESNAIKLKAVPAIDQEIYPVD
jgi:hypothetical protein